MFGGSGGSWMFLCLRAAGSFICGEKDTVTCFEVFISMCRFPCPFLVVCGTISCFLGVREERYAPFAIVVGDTCVVDKNVVGWRG